VIDLHLHLEGSLPPAVIGRLARRHRLDPPPRGFDGFPGFLRAFGAVCDLLRDPEDFDLAARAVLEQSRRIGLLHVEILFSPQVFLRRGIPLASLADGLERARAAHRRSRPSFVLIADGVRQWGPEWFDHVVASLEPLARRGLVAAIGLGGDERALPAGAFLPAYRRARSMGLRTTIHAGEAAGPEAVWEALRLPLDRIGHGIRSAEDPRLLRELAKRAIPLEVCPTSNVATGAAASLASHPLPRLMEAGVRVTINSDDGTFFRTDAPREMRRAGEAFGMTPEGKSALLRQAARAAFLPPRARAELERRAGRPAA
jgi:adenosine deaminase